MAARTPRRRWPPATAAAPSRRWRRPSPRFVASRDDMAGIIGIGGGGGTSIVTAGMRDLPLGLPKLMVSTLASGDVAPYVGVSDIMMVPSITDMAGLNRISRVVLHNAAQAIVAMAASPVAAADGKPALGLTMFGVTTDCVTAIAEHAARRLRLPGLPRHRHRRPDDGKARRLRHACRHPRHHHHGGLRPAVRRRAAGRPGPLRRRRAHEAALCRLGRRARHGQFLGAGDRPGPLSRPPVLQPQRQRHADAHDAGGMPRDRPMDRPTNSTPARDRCGS